MISRELTITNPTGLHTRPGNQFVKLAKTFSSDISVEKGDNAFNGKSLVKLMKAGVSQGDRVTIKCAGDDENEAADALARYVAELEE